MSDFKETCIWMSYRYAIGRKSITSVSHAEDIFKHLDWISEDRRKFTAEDIYNEINTKAGFSDNLMISFDGSRQTDVFSVLFEWFAQHPELCTSEYYRNHVFRVDLTTGDVDPRELDKPTYEYGTIFHEYSDYEGWIKLAKILSGETYDVTVEIAGETEVKQCVMWWAVINLGEGKFRIEKKYSIKDDRFPRWYISPEYIKEIKKL